MQGETRDVSSTMTLPGPKIGSELDRKLENDSWKHDTNQKETCSDSRFGE